MYLGSDILCTIARYLSHSVAGSSFRIMVYVNSAPKSCAGYSPCSHLWQLLEACQIRERKMTCQGATCVSLVLLLSTPPPSSSPQASISNPSLQQCKKKVFLLGINEGSLSKNMFINRNKCFNCRKKEFKIDSLARKGSGPHMKVRGILDKGSSYLVWPCH